MPPLSEMREDAASIFEAGLKAVDPGEAVKRYVTRERGFLEVCGDRYPFSKFHHIYVVGAGKASGLMARMVKGILGDRIDAGRVIVKYGHGVSVPDIEIIEAGHPVPDKNGVEGTAKIMHMVEGAGRQDLILCLISGGGSALLCSPALGVTLQDKRVTTELLLSCGAKIQEINAIRKHLSGIKGGQLARVANPATVISLILSDVVGDPVESIASGPTAADPSTFADCLSIVERYGIQRQIPPDVRLRLEKGTRGEVEETPKPADPLFANVSNFIVGSNRLAMEAAKRKAQDLGYHSFILSGFIEGETRMVAALHGAIAREINASGNPIPRPACIISGGETTVTLFGDGKGGRNQEFALAAALAIDGLPGTVVLSGGTDGTDGPTHVAGALVSGETVAKARRLGIDLDLALAQNNTFPPLRALRSHITTGPTGTNVNDLYLLLVL